MVAATRSINTKRVEGVRRRVRVAAGQKLFSGTMIALSGTGYAQMGATSTTLVAVGVLTDGDVDNSAGADGAVECDVSTGVFGPFANAPTDPILPWHIGQNCFMVDNQTVGKNSGGNTRSVAGRIFDVTLEGVWVSFS